MTKKLLTFVMLLSSSLFLKAQCGPTYSDNANFQNFQNSIGISFTTDASCGGTLNSITINEGFTSTAGVLATVRLYEGDGLAGNVLGELTSIEIAGASVFDFSALAISMNSSSQYTIMVSKDNPTDVINTGRGFNTPWFPPYTGGSLYINDTQRPGEHLAFSVNIDNSTLSVNDVNTDHKNVHIYPNPTTSFVHITGLSKEENYTVLDISGKSILTGTVDRNEEIDVQKLSKGIYFIQLKKQVLKFIKK